MSSETSTDLGSFKTFLEKESRPLFVLASAAFREENPDQNINVPENDIYNAIHFLKDIELYHAYSIDQDIVARDADKEEVEDHEANAGIIDYCRTEIGLCNLLIIRKLAKMERLIVRDYGTREFTEKLNMDWSFWAEEKMYNMLGEFSLSITDTMP